MHSLNLQVSFYLFKIKSNEHSMFYNRSWNIVINQTKFWQSSSWYHKSNSCLSLVNVNFCSFIIQGEIDWWHFWHIFKPNKLFITNASTHRIFSGGLFDRGTIFDEQRAQFSNTDCIRYTDSVICLKKFRALQSSILRMLGPL